MSSKGVYFKLTAIGEVRGKSKQALIQMNAEYPEFMKICKLAYDPMITYGIGQIIPAPYSEPGVDFDEQTYAFLDALASRDLTGNAARQTFLDQCTRLNKESATLLNWIIDKDLRSGFGASSLNKVAPGTIPEFPYMRCSLPKEAKLQEWDFTNGVISQEKADGMFMNIDHSATGEVAARSRQGQAFPLGRFADLQAEIRTRLAPNTQTHGEFLVINAAGEILNREIGNGILNSVFSGGEIEPGHRIILKVWDSIALDAAVPGGQYTVPYRVRLGLLFKGLKDTPGELIRPIDTRVVRSIKEAFDHYRHYLKQGKEGTVIKKMTAIWKDTTSREQVKLKLDADCDLRIVGFRPGEPGKKTEATFGALICRSECGQLEVGVSGMKDEIRQMIHDNRDDYLNGIVTVKSNSIMAPSPSNELYSLFLPRFVEVRKDKTEADSLERIRQQFDEAVQKVAA